MQKNTLSAAFLHRFLPVYSLNTLRSGAIIGKYTVYFMLRKE